MIWQQQHQLGSGNLRCAEAPAQQRKRLRAQRRQARARSRLEQSQRFRKAVKTLGASYGPRYCGDILVRCGVDISEHGSCTLLKKIVRGALEFGDGPHGGAGVDGAATRNQRRHVCDKGIYSLDARVAGPRKLAVFLKPRKLPQKHRRVVT